MESCIFRTAARYDRTVWGERPVLAMNAAKQQSTCSVTGNGSVTVNLVQKALNFFIAEL